MMRDPAAPGARLARLWRRLGETRQGRWIFSRMVGRTAPYSGTIQPLVLELAPGRCVVRMEDRRGLRNHVGSVHAIALANLAELASGLAMTQALPPAVRGIPTRLEVDYVKKARGTLTCTGTATPPLPVSGEVDAHARAEIRDEADTVVATALVRWRLGPI